MTEHERKPQFRLAVSAVLAHLRIPARMLLELRSADRIEVEAENIAGPVVRFEVQGYVVARGFVRDDGDRLSAKIFWTGCQSQDHQFDSWTIQHEPPSPNEDEPADALK
ncbi:MAG TPA: hypothetical protein VJ728_14350 [Candidatus Binataceae bacterium]|nr:hypothetical protein [Candidatus Binataceae bacterium]